MNATNDIIITKNEPMSRHTSWRAGGVAKQFVQAKSLIELKKFITTLAATENIFWLGLGSNTLVRDGGFNGTVIATQGIMNTLEKVDDETLYVGAGVSGAKLARYSKNYALQGAEFFAGIPGLLGGALAMNAGAFGSDTWSLITSVETLNRQGEITRYNKDEIDYGYRYAAIPKNEWFISANIKLKKRTIDADKNMIDIKKMLEKRAKSQPIGLASCGSVFRNPNNNYAAALIESCGLKGKRIGGAVISNKHANFIINDNNATANNIESLIEYIQKEVVKKHAIKLQTEVKIIGDRKTNIKAPPC